MTAPTRNTQFATDGSIGIDLATVGSNAAYFSNESHFGANGTEFVYVLAGAAVTKGGMVAIDAAGVATGVTGAAYLTSSTLSYRFGFAQTAFAASQWGFVAVRGSKVLVRVQGTVQQGAPLYTTDTGGELAVTTASASQFGVLGVLIETTASASGTSATVSTANLSWPLLRRPKVGS